MKKKESDDFNWFKWVGIEPKPIDQLILEAKEIGVPVFEADTEKDLYDRVLAVKMLKNNRSTVRTNIFIAVVTIISAIASVISAIVGLS